MIARNFQARQLLPRRNWQEVHGSTASKKSWRRRLLRRQTAGVKRLVSCSLFVDSLPLTCGIVRVRIITQWAAVKPPVKEKTVSQLPGTASRNVPKSVIVLTPDC